MSMKQPISQVRLTNIAVVRYRSGGNNYEIACFPNKVLDWRKKIETNIQNVLQSDTIFKNVSKAEICSARDLYNAFETTDKDAICKIVRSYDLHCSYYFALPFMCLIGSVLRFNSTLNHTAPSPLTLSHVTFLPLSRTLFLLSPLLHRFWTRV